MKKVIVTSGWGVRYPTGGGMQWLSVHYLAGLNALGVEGFWLDVCNRPRAENPGYSPEPGVAAFRAACERFGWGDRWAAIFNRAQFFGMTERQLRALCGDCDLLINLSGALKDDDLLGRIKRRAYFDLDPAFTQVWAQQWELGLGKHDWHFTVGLNVGRPAFPVPSGGIRWETFRPPVALEHWPVQPEVAGALFTTIGQWRGQEATWQEEYYGPKSEEFPKFQDLPRRTPQPMELAMLIHETETEDIARIKAGGWRLVDPEESARGLDGYRAYIQRSRAEFSFAKSGYVKSRSGWFSDRTVCYLASGRPALVQDTGFREHLPTGHGLVSFTTVEEAARGIEAINADYPGHCAAARRLAEEQFAAPKVLADILERTGVV